MLLYACAYKKTEFKTSRKISIFLIYESVIYSIEMTINDQLKFKIQTQKLSLIIVNANLMS